MMSKIFFSADHHFGHKNIIKYCDRPWHDRDSMDDDLINLWNATVPEDGVVFYAGDFSFRGTGETMAIMEQLNGTKHLIRGNHDTNVQEGVLKQFASILDYTAIHVEELSQHIVISHYPFRTWEKMHYGAWQLHGHSHGKLPPMGGQLDIGIDRAAALLGQYRPFNLLEIQEHIGSANEPSDAPKTTQQHCNKAA